MRIKLKLGFFMVAIVIGLMFVACPLEFDARGIVRNEVPWGGTTFSRTLSANATGWMDAPMTVTVTFTNGFITNVIIDHNETPDHGGILIDRAIPLIIMSNYFEIDIITGASVLATRRALLEAWGSIRAQVGGGNGQAPSWQPPLPPSPPSPFSPPASGVADATIGGWAFDDPYFQETNGFRGRPIRVTVTMENGFITEVDLYGPDETPGLGTLVMDRAIPTIIAWNSFNFAHLIIDTVAGNSYTYRGIRRGGEAAVQQLLDAHPAP